MGGICIVRHCSAARWIEDVAVACTNSEVWLARADSNLAPLARLRRTFRVVADAVLPSQLFSNIRKRIRHVLQRVSVVLATTSAVCKRQQILATNLVITSARAAS